VYDQFGARLNEGAEAIDAGALNRHELGEAIFEKIRARYDVKEQIIGAPAMRYHERIVMLSVLDGLWKDHLLAMDHLKEGIGLRGYAQQDPLVAYKKESFEMFEAMMLRFQEDTARHLFRMQIIGPDGMPIETADQVPRLPPAPPSGPPELPAPALPSAPRRPPAGQAALPMDAESSAAPQQRAAVPVPTRAASTTIDALEKEFQQKKRRELDQARAAGAGASASTNGNAPRATGDKVGRNDLCPCGSGKKYKKCHGAQG
jgi:preprotein translocase subunit SecA